MFYLIFLVCQYLRWVQYARNRVHVTRFVRLENEFNELGFYSCKPSSLNSVCFEGNHHPCWVRVNHRKHHSKKHFRHTKKPNTQKKPSSNFKHTVTLSLPSHSQSLPLTLSRALSHSHTLIPSLSLHRRLLPLPSLPLTSVAVAASRFRRRCCLSLPLVRLRVA